ncbi:MAG: hypothetical protein Q4E32_03345 [Bacteroidales bacterium]|nr:hypothetical protein [Bacteroidales bacterium]
MKKITDLFRHGGYGDYRKSQHKDVYEKIANKHKCNPQRVYEIAHGRRVKGFDDRLVREDLITEGILMQKAQP